MACSGPYGLGGRGLPLVAGEAVVKGEAWYLAVWGLAVVVAQVAALGGFGEGSAALAAYAVYLASGLALGVNAGLWVRMTESARGRWLAWQPATLWICGRDGSLRRCGWRVLVASVPAAG